MIRTFYRQRQDVNSFLQINDSVSRTNYFRILALASIDILLTLPLGIASIALAVSETLSTPHGFPFYFGWTLDHTNWEPFKYPYHALVAQGTPSVVQVYFSHWTSPILAFAIFGLFGVTADARASYRSVICNVCGWFGPKPKMRGSRPISPSGDIQLGGRPPRDHKPFDLDVECVISPWHHLTRVNSKNLDRSRASSILIGAYKTTFRRARLFM